MSPNNLYIIISSIFATVIGYDIYNWLKGREIVAPEIRLERFKSKINNTVLTLGAAMIAVSILFHVNFLRYSKPIPFSEIDKISLKDFKGYRKPYQTLDGQREFAFITTSINFEKIDRGIELHALFHPARSYVYNDRIVDRFLLKHELYHFRITEIFARRCRQRLSQEEPVSDETVDDIVSSHSEMEGEMQRLYDEESYHGYLMKEQKKWENDVDSLLNLLNNYKTPIVVYE